MVDLLVLVLSRECDGGGHIPGFGGVYADRFRNAQVRLQLELTGICISREAKNPEGQNGVKKAHRLKDFVAPFNFRSKL